jgi:hypothetical protein
MLVALVVDFGFIISKKINIVLLKLMASIGVVSVILHFVPVEDIYAVIILAGPLWLCAGVIIIVALAATLADRLKHQLNSTAWSEVKVQSG